MNLKICKTVLRHWINPTISNNYWIYHGIGTYIIKTNISQVWSRILVASMVALSLIREIAPVITTLICAGKVSSGIGAELGSMKVTEQIDAMEVSV
jgi:ABC-type transporter Mla maintaining outer membrane lipid asymmetry permease subunit MlaE